jgi:hypothetical protein
LQDGDELASYPGHTVPTSRNLAALYRTTLQASTERAAYLAILAINNVANTPTAVNAWVKATGGKQLGTFAGPDGRKLPQFVFSSTSKILLPPGGPRPPVEVSPPSTTKPRMRAVGIGLLIAGVAYAISKKGG